MKYTNKEFDRFLDAFAERNEAWMVTAVRLVTSRALWSELTSEISDIKKQSLVRKVLRYVAQTALRGSFDVDGLAFSGGFADYRNGYPISLASDTYWSFWSSREGTQVTVETADGVVVYTWINIETEKPCTFVIDIPEGCHYKLPQGKADIVQYFEDPRVDIFSRSNPTMEQIQKEASESSIGYSSLEAILDSEEW